MSPGSRLGGTPGQHCSLPSSTRATRCLLHLSLTLASPGRSTTAHRTAWVPAVTGAEAGDGSWHPERPPRDHRARLGLSLCICQMGLRTHPPGQITDRRAQAQPDSAWAGRAGEAGGARKRSGERGVLPGPRAYPRSCPYLPHRVCACAPQRESGWDRGGDCPVPQRPPRQQALTWPPSEPPSCGSETNACLRAASAPRPPRVRLGWGRGGGGGRVEARREAEPGR